MGRVGIAREFAHGAGNAAVASPPLDYQNEITVDLLAMKVNAWKTENARKRAIETEWNAVECISCYVGTTVLSLLNMNAVRCCLQPTVATIADSKSGIKFERSGAAGVSKR